LVARIRGFPNLRTWGEERFLMDGLLVPFFRRKRTVGKKK
jgi:hypothetical protein